MEEPPTASQITAKLSQNAYSVRYETGGLTRCDGALLDSNNPCEDYFNRPRTFEIEGVKWTAVAVFDGHSGPHMARYLEQHLLDALQRGLEEAGPRLRSAEAEFVSESSDPGLQSRPENAGPQLQSGEATSQPQLEAAEPQAQSDKVVEDIIVDTFVQLDDVVIKGYLATAQDKQMPLAVKIQRAQVALSGSCALVCIYNSRTRTLYTACVGDSRAVLGEQHADGKWHDVELSKDQTGENDEEVARVQGEHPGETVFDEKKRLLGLGVSRAFGKLTFKSTYDDAMDLAKRHQHESPNPKEKIPTPPYLTARPVVTVQRLQQRPTFLILATDGIWEMCESWEVVDLIVRWMEAQPDAGKTLRMTPESVWWKREPEGHTPYDPAFDFLEIWDGFDRRFRRERTVIEDLDNVAVHLLRNACGGDHKQMLEAYLAMQAPHSRENRDDMTVQVIFFDIDHVDKDAPVHEAEHMDHVQKSDNVQSVDKIE